MGIRDDQALAAISAASFRFRRDRDIDSAPSTAIVVPSVASAALWAVVSIPRAIPESDGYAGAGQVARHPFGRSYSVGRGMPGAHDADADGRKELVRPVRTRRGRIEDLAERFRIQASPSVINRAPASGFLLLGAASSKLQPLATDRATAPARPAA